MLKRVLIISLNLLLFISLTGLPLTINFCKVNPSPQVENCQVMDACSMNENIDNCNKDINKKDTESLKANCCKTISLQTIVKDNFISPRTEISHNRIIAGTLNFSTLLGPGQLKTSSKFAAEESPPYRIKNPIYLKNSSFLI